MMSTCQLATFYLDDALWGINVRQIREILKGVEVVRVPAAPDYIAGLMNLRGQIVTVIDLAVRLGRTSASGSRDTCIILKTDADLAAVEQEELEQIGADPVGLLVDRMGDVLTVAAGQLEPPPANTAGVERKFVSGVVKLQEGLVLRLVLGAVVET